MSRKDDLRFGDIVVIPWGFTEVRGRVAEVYGPEQQRRVVIALVPELSSYVVDEATTVALPLTHVRRFRGRTSSTRTVEGQHAVEAGEARPADRRVRSASPDMVAAGDVHSGEWVDVAGAAAYLGASTSFVRKLVLERRVRHYKVGSLLRFDRDDLDAFVRAGVVEPARDPGAPTRSSRR